MANEEGNGKLRDINERTFQFACRVIRLHRCMTSRRGTDRALAGQLLRSATSIGSNLEEAKAGQSRADFVSKVRISLKEARESHYWLRLFEATGLVPFARINPLVREANEIVAILTTIVKKASHQRSIS
jgi:four helix bundle protein